MEFRSDTKLAHIGAVGEVFLAAAVWSSSFIGIKFVLQYTGALTLAGLRYFIAFLILLPFLLRFGKSNLPLSGGQWRRLVLMGVSQYTIGNGALFLALRTLPATTGSLVLCLSPIPVLALSSFLLKERPGRLQLLGIVTAVGGSLAFFLPGLDPADWTGLGFLGLAVLGFSLFPVLARGFARTQAVGNIALTAIPLGIGGGLLVIIAGFTEGVPQIPLTGWGVIMGLAIVNTVIGYLLYNHALRRLTAVEAAVALNLTPLGTALIAWGTLGERLTPLQLGAVFIVIIGASLAQRRRPVETPRP